MISKSNEKFSKKANRKKAKREKVSMLNIYHTERNYDSFLYLREYYLI